MDLGVDLVVGLDVVAGLGLEDLGGRAGSLEVSWRGFVCGGVASFRTDMSESASSTGLFFRFFFGGDLSTDFFLPGESGTTTFAGLLTCCFAGDDGGVSLIKLFFRLIFFATN